MGQTRAVIYCRVSTDDQCCDRQERDLLAYAERAGYEVSAIYKETGSGVKLDRQERKKVLTLARRRECEIVLVTEASRWSRSTIDLIETLQELSAYGVSLVAQSGLQFDLQTPQGKLFATLLGALGEFERDLIRERIRSGIANAKARGKVFGHRKGHYPSDEKYLKKVKEMKAEGMGNLAIARKLGCSKNTITSLCRRHGLTVDRSVDTVTPSL